MKFIFITEEDPFYVYLFFEHFFQRYDIGGADLVGIAILEPFNKKSTRALAKQMYHFYGALDFLRMGLRYVLKKLTGHSIGGLASRHNIPIFDVKNINDADFHRRLREMQLDLIISVAAPQKFKAELLALPSWGCINIHTGKLPQYRGMMPSFWTLLNEEEYGAVTIHKMNENLDDGEIILQQDVKIDKDETLDSYIRKTKKLGAELMLNVIEKIRDNKVELSKNDAERATYFSFPTRDDVRLFKSKGKRLF